MKTLILAVFLTASLPTWASLNVYSDRPQARFAKAAAAYQQATGEDVVFHEMAYPDMVKRLQTEGATSPANVLISKDIVYLDSLKSQKFFKPMQPSPALDAVNDFMRDSDNQWVALSFRVRSVVYASTRVNGDEFSTYEDLADPKWAGRLCLRSGKAAYSEALVASLLVANGEDKTGEIVSGWLANLGGPIFKDDMEIITAITNGSCDIGIVNHYYLAGALNANPNLDVKMAFLDQDGLGVSTNGMGAGLSVTNTNPNAQKFIELMLTPENQLDISASHFDFPVLKNLQPNTFIKDWGPFKMNPTSWTEIGAKSEAARELIQEAGYR